jgi:hypothetical protein
MEHERLFSFTWPHRKSFEKSAAPQDYSAEPTTLVEFRLEKTATGTLLMVTSPASTSFPRIAVSTLSEGTRAVGRSR